MNFINKIKLLIKGDLKFSLKLERVRTSKKSEERLKLLSRMIINEIENNNFCIEESPEVKSLYFYWDFDHIGIPDIHINSRIYNLNLKFLKNE